MESWRLKHSAKGHWLSSVATWIIQRRQTKFRKELQDHDLSLEKLEVLNGDDDGEVSRAEFLEFMLIFMVKVDRQLLDELNEHFSRRDEDGNGTLKTSLLRPSARCQVRGRKIELAQYKRQLLEANGDN